MFRRKFDGEKEGTLFIFSMPLSNSEFEWSGNQYFCVPVITYEGFSLGTEANGIIITDMEASEEFADLLLNA